MHKAIPRHADHGQAADMLQAQLTRSALPYSGKCKMLHVCQTGFEKHAYTNCPIFIEARKKGRKGKDNSWLAVEGGTEDKAKSI